MKSTMLLVTFILLNLVISSQTLSIKADSKEYTSLGINCDSILIVDRNVLLPFKFNFLNNETGKLEYFNYLNFRLSDSLSYAKRKKETNCKVLYSKIKYKYLATSDNLKGVVIEFSDLKYELFNERVEAPIQITLYENGFFEYHYKNPVKLNEYLVNILSYLGEENLSKKLFSSFVTSSNNKFVSGLTINPIKLFPTNNLSPNNHFSYGYDNYYVSHNLEDKRN